MRTGIQPGSSHRRALALVCAGTLALAACHHAPPPPSNVTPEKAVSTNLRLTAAGDFDGLMRNRLPPADYTVWRQEWDAQRAHPRPVSVAQQQQFAKIMQMLTEPGAEAKLLQILQPELAGGRGKDQPVPVFASILEAAGKQMIETSPQLGRGQRLLALQVLAAITGWTGDIDFNNHKRLAKAVALLCDTARQLHVQTLEQWRALDYATAMRDYGIIWTGMEQLLDLYGLDLADSLTRAKPATVSILGNEAVIQLSLNVAGQSLTGQWTLRKVAGHWYDAALLDAWRAAHPLAAATVAPVAAASVPPPTPSVSTAPSPQPAGTTAAPPVASAGPMQPQI